ncbi:zf-HC2 domain-containing protein [bacterium]|nr:zf-HC2 domain-containing protein [bacterium]
MKEPLNLLAALKESLRDSAENPETGHPGEIALYEFLQGLLSPDRARTVQRHVDQCPNCRTQVEDFRKGIETARGIDVTPPAKRAAAPGDVVRVQTRDGAFQLVFRPSLQEPQRGVLIVRTDRRDLEGQRVIVRDSLRKTVLEGKLVAGEVSQTIPNAASVLLSELLVMALKDAD